MRLVRFALALVAVTLLSACAERTQVRDVPRGEATWLTGRQIVADGPQLKMIFHSDTEGLEIRRVDYKVYEGELYLWPVRASDTFRPVEFTLDTSKLKLREPWTEHVYWVESANWNNIADRIVHPSPLGDRVERVKAEVVSE